MNRQKWILLIAAAILMAGGAGFLARLGAHQKLGMPGIKSQPVPGQVVVKLALPEKVLDFASTNVEQEATVTNTLPKDTSYTQRRYTAPDGFYVNVNLVLMGTDRTSIHKPEFCLPGQGWTIEKKATVDVPIQGESAYHLPVAKWFLSGTFPSQDGGKMTVSGIYVFWFVADNEQTVSHWQRLWMLARDLMRHGVLQRWAYVSYFSVCAPGQEEATFERMKQLVAASVPGFQLPPRGAGGSGGELTQE